MSEHFAEILKRIPPQRSTDYAYKMGYDCGANGPNLTNCGFAIFSTSENTREWERGKRDADAIKGAK